MLKDISFKIMKIFQGDTHADRRAHLRALAPFGTAQGEVHAFEN